MGQRDTEIAGLRNLIKLCTRLAWKEEEEEEENKATRDKRNKRPSLSSTFEDSLSKIVEDVVSKE